MPLITCERCGKTTNDPDLWDPEAGTGRIFCDACWPHRDEARQALTARPATENAIELVALALDAATEVVAAEGSRGSAFDRAAARSAVLEVLRAILGSDGAPASDLLDARLNGEPSVIVAR